MEFYEFNFLISPVLSQAEADALAEKMEAELQKFGKSSSDKKTDRRRLSYPINKETEAWFSFITLYPEAGKDKGSILQEIEKMFKEEKNVLRMMTIKKRPVKISAIRRRPSSKISEEAKAEPEKEEEKKPVKTKAQLEEIGQKLDEMLGE